jgi:FkbM family methyltransferase
MISYANSFQIKPDGILKIIYNKSVFEFSLKYLSQEDKNLIELIFTATKFGADLITNDGMGVLRKKSVKITKMNNKRVVETYDGLKFFLDSINPGNTITETFVSDIHDINSKIGFKGKTVIDVGAECGDTALYFANKGATVYAIEPMKSTYEAMIRNLELNPELSKRIIPINGGIGKNDMLRFYHDKNNAIGESASFVYNVHKNTAVSEIKGYTVNAILKKFNIDQVELLKIDCKGCEFFLTDEDLLKVNIVKIEYNAKLAGQSLDKLLNIIEKSGFIYTLYKHSISDRISLKERGTILGIKRRVIEGK